MEEMLTELVQQRNLYVDMVKREAMSGGFDRRFFEGKLKAYEEALNAALNIKYGERIE